jgi:hypothetical protein
MVLRYDLWRFRKGAWPTGRSFTQHARCFHQAKAVSEAFGTVDIELFRQATGQLKQPLLMKAPRDVEVPLSFPASARWFANDPLTTTGSEDPGPSSLNSTYMDQFGSAILPFELIVPPAFESKDSGDTSIFRFQNWLSSNGSPLAELLDSVQQHESTPNADQSKFLSFHSPFLLFLKALEFNKLQIMPVKQLYIAQAGLEDLPAAMNQDLPTPSIVRNAGAGDIYNSSIWLGLEPTYTPIHRDPNPNLFCQMCSSKIIRLLPPKTGDLLYQHIQSQIHRQGNSRIRTSEMMEGPERQAFHSAVWGLDVGENFIEAHLDPGDALFIPTGWWHSVKSKYSDGRLNASVNWWFR